MKLSEIRAAAEKHVNIVQAGPMLHEDFAEYSQRCWDSKPRVPFDELPASLQKFARNRYTPDVLKQFLTECYSTPEFEQRVKEMTAEERFKLPNSPETYVSFQSMVNGIDENTLEGLLIRARNTATYTIEGTGTFIDTKNKVYVYSTETLADDDLYPMLYGNHACEAFENVLQQYQKTLEARTTPVVLSQEEAAAIVSQVVQPKEIIAPKDLVTRKIFRNEIPYDKQGIVISGDRPVTVKDENGKTKKLPYAPIVSLSLLNLPSSVQITRAMSPMDNIIHKTLCSLFDAGNKQFTGQAIYSAMTGSDSADATADWLAVIDESWTRLTTTIVEIDTGTIGDAYKQIRWKRQRPIIQGGRDTITVTNQYGQNSVTLYSIAEKPILQTYAEIMNQIDRYPRILQNTPVNKTPETLVLQNLLLDHINAIPNISNHIRYDTLWDLIKIQAKTPAALRKKKTVLRGYIHKMLDYWKGTGFITGWKEEKKGNVVHSIVIAKPKKNEALPPAQQKN